MKRLMYIELFNISVLPFQKETKNAQGNNHIFSPIKIVHNEQVNSLSFFFVHFVHFPVVSTISICVCWKTKY
jgi:hypothetical protein